MGSRSPLRERAVCTRPKSTAHASPIFWRSEPQRRAALGSHERGDSLFCSHEPVRVRRPCLTRRLLWNWHVPEPGAPTPGCRQLVPITRALVRPCIGRSTFRQRKRSSTIPPVHSQIRFRASERSPCAWNVDTSPQMKHKCPSAFTRATTSLARGSGRCSKGSSTTFPRLM